MLKAHRGENSQPTMDKDVMRTAPSRETDTDILYPQPMVGRLR